MSDKTDELTDVDEEAEPVTDGADETTTEDSAPEVGAPAEDVEDVDPAIAALDAKIAELTEENDGQS